MSYNIVAIDDHEVTLLGLENALAGTSTCRLVLRASTVDEVTERLGTTDVPALDLALLDLRLADGSDPFVNVTALHDAGLRVLVFSSLESPYLARRALRAGVYGVVEKTAAVEVLCAAVAAACSGETFPTADWASYIDSDPGYVDFPPRLQQVLELYASGESGKRVASLTGLSAATVQDYVNRIRERYAQAGREATTKIELYKRAQEDGFLPGPCDV